MLAGQRVHPEDRDAAFTQQMVEHAHGECGRDGRVREHEIERMNGQVRYEAFGLIDAAGEPQPRDQIEGGLEQAPRGELR